MKKAMIFALGSSLLVFGSCRKQPAKISLEPPSSPPEANLPADIGIPPAPSPPVKWPAPTPPPTPGKPPRPAPAVYRSAEEDFDSGRYVLAARGYESYLRDYPSRGKEDRVLFRLGLSYALSDSSPPGLKKSKSRLERLITFYPDSHYRPQARLILDLQNQLDQRVSELQGMEERIRQLTEEIGKLKKIDMERQPSRPPR